MAQAGSSPPAWLEAARLRRHGPRQECCAARTTLALGGHVPQGWPAPCQQQWPGIREQHLVPTSSALHSRAVPVA